MKGSSAEMLFQRLKSLASRVPWLACEVHCLECRRNLLENVPEPDVVAVLTRFAGDFMVKEPAMKFPRLTWTARDVGGPGVEPFGMISEHSSPERQGRLVT